jgi:hypothetical protein
MTGPAPAGPARHLLNALIDLQRKRLLFDKKLRFP